MSEKKKIKRKLRWNAKLFIVSLIVLLSGIAFAIIVPVTVSGPHEAEFSKEIGQYYTRIEISQTYGELRESLINLRSAINGTIGNDASKQLIWIEEDSKTWVVLKEIDNSLLALSERADWIITENSNLSINGLTQKEMGTIFNQVKDNIESGLERGDVFWAWEKENHHTTFILGHPIVWIPVIILGGLSIIGFFIGLIEWDYDGWTKYA